MSASELQQAINDRLQKMSVGGGTGYHTQYAPETQLFINEIIKRDQVKLSVEMLTLTKEMNRYTRQITWLTKVVTIATVLALVIATIGLWVELGRPAF